MKRRWLYYACCLIAPHIMLIVGLVFLAAADNNKKTLGKRLCLISTLVLALGALTYYIYFTPIFGLE